MEQWQRHLPPDSWSSRTDRRDITQDQSCLETGCRMTLKVLAAESQIGTFRRSAPWEEFHQNLERFRVARDHSIGPVVRLQHLHRSVDIHASPGVVLLRWRRPSPRGAGARPCMNESQGGALGFPGCVYLAPSGNGKSLAAIPSCSQSRRLVLRAHCRCLTLAVIAKDLLHSTLHVL